jgi:coatomer protein complex subunit gamma
MKQITGFMNEIADEFKIIIVEAVRSLCIKFPSKQFQMMTFLATGLRDEGGYELKGTIVDAIFDIVNKIPESKEMGTTPKTYILALAHLCEFIEDCEYTKLSVRILHLLGSHGPSVASNPSRYIRFIYNRVILENSTIRAAAVAALAQFAVAIEDLRPRIKILLNRCLEDQDDEVRDRAALYLAILESPTLQANYIENGMLKFN